MGAMRGREGGKGGGSGGVRGVIAGERMVAVGAEAAVVEGVGFVGMVGAGAVRGGRVLEGKIIIDVGAGKGAVEAVTADGGSAGCGEGFETLFHALSKKISFCVTDFGSWWN